MSSITHRIRNWLLGPSRTCANCGSWARDNARMFVGREVIEATTPVYEQPAVEGPHGMEETGEPVRTGTIRKRFLVTRRELEDPAYTQIIRVGRGVKAGACQVHCAWRMGDETCDQFTMRGAS